MPDLKHFLPLLVYIAAAVVIAGALLGAGQRLLARSFPSLTEAAYFAAGLGLLLWAVR